MCANISAGCVCSVCQCTHAGRCVSKRVRTAQRMQEALGQHAPSEGSIVFGVNGGKRGRRWLKLFGYGSADRALTRTGSFTAPAYPRGAHASTHTSLLEEQLKLMQINRIKIEQGRQRQRQRHRNGPPICENSPASLRTLR